MGILLRNEELCPTGKLKKKLKTTLTKLMPGKISPRTVDCIQDSSEVKFWLLPVDGGLIVGFQIMIRLGKGTTAKETVVGGEGGGMGGLDNQVSAGINESAFSLGIVAPKNEDQVFFFFGQAVDDSVGKKFPTFILVRTGLMGPDGEGGV